ncbi:MAG: bifunctional phosphopantothenoylcysteine decarboxylase/phosphopantothenate--cysteine ligase CoaBC [Thermodesulfobacteriota bacterium]
MILKGKNIVLAVTGGIGAYKALELTRDLVKEGSSVYPVMTRAAKEFITPLSLATLAGRPVATSLFKEGKPGQISHIELTDLADLIIIAPATANIIGKIAGGIADDLLTTLVMAASSPVLIAPAMNDRMYGNPIVENNIEKLSELGYHFVGPGTGALACGYEGKGRLAGAGHIVEEARCILTRKDLKSETVLVTAGPTREMIDPVRFLSNPSTGWMGYALASAAKRRGAKVILISGPTQKDSPPGIDAIQIESAAEMQAAVKEEYPSSTVVIMCAAVADYRPSSAHKEKIKKEKKKLTVEFDRTVDILKELGKNKDDRVLVGFALETEHMIENATKKLKEKHLDMVVANGPKALSSPVNEVAIVTMEGEEAHSEIMPELTKEELSNKILDRIILIKSS